MTEVLSTSDTGRFHVRDVASVRHRRPAVASLVRDTYALVLAGGRGTHVDFLLIVEKGNGGGNHVHPDLSA